MADATYEDFTGTELQYVGEHIDEFNEWWGKFGSQSTEIADALPDDQRAWMVSYLEHLIELIDDLIADATGDPQLRGRLQSTRNHMDRMRGVFEF